MCGFRGWPERGHERVDPRRVVSQLGQQLRIPRGLIRPEQVVAAHQAALPVANMVLTMSLPTTYLAPAQAATFLATVLPLLPATGVFHGTERRPFQRPLRRHPERGQVGLHGTRTTAGLVLAPVIHLGTQTVPLDQRTLSLVLPEHGWALVAST